LPTAPSSALSRKLDLAWSSTDEVPAMLQVAFATDDRVRVNQHFGASVGFAIFALDGERAKLVSVAEFADDTTMDGNDNKLPTKIATLKGCAAVYCLAVGGSAVRQLIAAGVQPIRLEEETNIERLLGELQKAVRDGGVPWVEKALGRDKDNGRFDRMAEEGWTE
ncbi:MAG TPA: NifB/NifX family molybdenum-iron cluster-binding protein, partial [Rhodocyclaceae bacterium]|nr:NifB/NifX family molybdenum-iron cluster-binding protein [Rhodocyclaceae bacterium]